MDDQYVYPEDNLATISPHHSINIEIVSENKCGWNQTRHDGICVSDRPLQKGDSYEVIIQGTGCVLLGITSSLPSTQSIADGQKLSLSIGNWHQIRLKESSEKISIEHEDKKIWVYTFGKVRKPENGIPIPDSKTKHYIIANALFGDLVIEIVLKDEKKSKKKVEKLKWGLTCGLNVLVQKSQTRFTLRYINPLGFCALGQPLTNGTGFSVAVQETSGSWHYLSIGLSNKAPETLALDNSQTFYTSQHARGKTPWPKPVVPFLKLKCPKLNNVMCFLWKGGNSILYQEGEAEVKEIKFHGLDILLPIYVYLEPFREHISVDSRHLLLKNGSTTMSSDYLTAIHLQYDKIEPTDQPSSQTQLKQINAIESDPEQTCLKEISEYSVSSDYETCGPPAFNLPRDPRENTLDPWENTASDHHWRNSPQENRASHRSDPGGNRASHKSDPGGNRASHKSDPGGNRATGHLRRIDLQENTFSGHHRRFDPHENRASQRSDPGGNGASNQHQFPNPQENRASGHHRRSDPTENTFSGHHHWRTDTQENRASHRSDPGGNGASDQHQFSYPQENRAGVPNSDPWQSRTDFVRQNPEPQENTSSLSSYPEISEDESRHESKNYWPPRTSSSNNRENNPESLPAPASISLADQKPDNFAKNNIILEMINNHGLSQNDKGKPIDGTKNNDSSQKKQHLNRKLLNCSTNNDLSIKKQNNCNVSGAKKLDGKDSEKMAQFSDNSGTNFMQTPRTDDPSFPDNDNLNSHLQSNEISQDIVKGKNFGRSATLPVKLSAVGTLDPTFNNSLFHHERAYSEQRGRTQQSNMGGQHDPRAQQSSMSGQLDQRAQQSNMGGQHDPRAQQSNIIGQHDPRAQQSNMSGQHDPRAQQSSTRQVQNTRQVFEIGTKVEQLGATPTHGKEISVEKTKNEQSDTSTHQLRDISADELETQQAVMHGLKVFGSKNKKSSKEHLETHQENGGKLSSNTNNGSKETQSTRPKILKNHAMSSFDWEEELWKNCLQANFTYFIDRAEPVSLTDKLYEKLCLGDIEFENISKEPTRNSQCREIIKILKRKPQCKHDFLLCLDLTRQHHIADRLRKYLENNS